MDAVPTIYHLAWRSDWEKGCSGGVYRAASLETEGFIHATKEPEKLLEVAAMFFPGPGGEDLLCIELDESAAGSPVRYEDPGCGHLFPHLYGPIDLAAVVSIRPLRWTGEKWEPPG